MIRLCCVSDNHRKVEVLDRIMKNYPNCDAYLHAGDSELDWDTLSAWTAVVAGNNDYNLDFNDIEVVTVKGYRILLTHSHLVVSSKRIERLVAMAHQYQCQMVVFGHTHVFFAKEVDGVFLFNPGSVYYNRDYSDPCFGVVEVDELTYKVKNVLRISVKDLEF